MNTFGEHFKITLFGESHGDLIGVVVDGVPPGLELDVNDVQKELDKRIPGTSELYTSRVEEDKVEVVSGVFNRKSTGAPITMLIRNTNVDSQAYEKLKELPRPSHADYSAWVKYHGFNDPRGGGQFSGRTTAAIVMAGAIAKKLLSIEGIELAAHSIQIGKVKLDNQLNFADIKHHRWSSDARCADPDVAKKMEQEILEAKADNDSVGGVIECMTTNIPAGLGEPYFDTVEGELSKLLFAIPGIKGISFGSGFNSAQMRGSEHNDQFTVVDNKIITETNYSGGILGGITNGMPIVFQVAIKPTASISKRQMSVNLNTLQREEIKVEGEHDPCIVPRAIPVIEACTSIVLLDLALRSKSKANSSLHADSRER